MARQFDIEDIFNDIPKSEIPNNRPVFSPCEPLTIVTGETTKQTFDIPFDISSTCESYELLYTLGWKVILTKTSNDVETIYDPETDVTVIECILSSDETKMFANSLLETRLQIKFMLLDGGQAYSYIYPIKVITTLDNLNIGG